MKWHLGKGLVAERLAEAYLRSRGLRLVTRNFRCRGGEVDLIMLTQQQLLVFIEVRYRQSAAFGGAAASIDVHKQQRLIRAAQTFLQQNRQFNRTPCRFDVVTFEGSWWRIRWLNQAFDVNPTRSLQ